MEAELSLHIRLQQKLFADPRRIELLKRVQQTGSISQGRSWPVSATKVPGMRLMR